MRARGEMTNQHNDRHMHGRVPREEYAGVCVSYVCIFVTLYLDQRRQNHLSFGHSSLLCTVTPNGMGRIEQINKTCPYTGHTMWHDAKATNSSEKDKERERENGRERGGREKKGDN